MAKKIDYASMYTCRPSGLYQGYWRDTEGKRHSIYDRDPERLHMKIQEKESPPPVTFREIAEAWHDMHWDAIRYGTKSCYGSAYSRAVERCGGIPAAELTPLQIYNHLLLLQAQGYSAKTVKTQRTVYSLIYKAAIIHPEYSKTIQTNPAAATQLPSNLPRPQHREAPEDDVIQKIKTGAAWAYWGLFAYFLICTGFRRGEALGVRWRDIDLKTGRIHCTCSVSHRCGVASIGPPKTDAGIRSVPLLDGLREYLVMPKGAKPTDFVFCGEDPSVPIPQATYNRRWLHYCKDQGFVVDAPEIRISKQKHRYVVHHYKPTLTAHMLRHGYATILFEAGVDVYTAQRLLGHANIDITLGVYTHLRQRRLDQSEDALSAYARANL